VKILFIQKIGFGAPSNADAFFLPLAFAKLGHEVTLVVRGEPVVESIVNYGVQVIPI